MSKKEGLCDWKVARDGRLRDEFREMRRGQVTGTLWVTVRSWAYILSVTAVERSPLHW